MGGEKMIFEKLKKLGFIEGIAEKSDGTIRIAFYVPTFHYKTHQRVLREWGYDIIDIWVAEREAERERGLFIVMDLKPR